MGDKGLTETRLAQALGIAVCLGILVGWLILGLWPIRTGGVTARAVDASDPTATLVFQRTERYGAPGWTRPMALMAVLAVVGGIAAAFRLPLLMYAVFICSFFPIGIYLLGAPRGWPVGMLDLLLLLSAVVLHVALARERNRA